MIVPAYSTPSQIYILELPGKQNCEYELVALSKRILYPPREGQPL